MSAPAALTEHKSVPRFLGEIAIKMAISSESKLMKFWELVKVAFVGSFILKLLQPFVILLISCAKIIYTFISITFIIRLKFNLKLSIVGRSAIMRSEPHISKKKG